MPEEATDKCMAIIREAIQKCTKEEDMAREIRHEVDSALHPSWNVIVGKNFGAHVVN